MTPELTTYLISQGGLSIAIAWLLLDRHRLTQKADKFQDESSRNLLAIIEKVTKAIEAATGAFQVNNAVQQSAGEAARNLGEAVRIMQLGLASLEKDVERLSDERSGRGAGS